jgi:hypothetical protein
MRGDAIAPRIADRVDLPFVRAGCTGDGAVFGACDAGATGLFVG